MRLQDRWKSLVSPFTQDQLLTHKLWQEIEHAYCASGRHYHNLLHLTNLLQLATTYRSSLQHPELVYLAIFYHDIVYHPLKKDNEEKSARLAVERLRQLGLPPQEREQVRHLILATKTHQATADSDTQWLLDFDLSILGTPWPGYLEYTRQIRREYRLIPYFLYRKGRKKVVIHFLEMEQIYKTPVLATSWEVAARQNLLQELQTLR